jgi:predicted nucleic acid-binding protein
LRVFVDTSVWVDYLRGRTTTVRRDLAALLEEDRVALAAPVRVELLAGARRDQVSQLRHLLAAIPTYRPTDSTWAAMEEWAVRGAREGQRFGVADLLVGAIAREQGGPLWSLDDDFQRMAALHFVELYSPDE